MSADLKPCPFCDGPAAVECWDETSGFWARCCVTRCSAEGPSEGTAAEAIAAWNRRAPDSDSARAEAERLRARAGRLEMLLTGALHHVETERDDTLATIIRAALAPETPARETDQ